jgi:class 3 adenylate cyclase
LEEATKLLLAFQLETLGDAALANIIFDDGSRATTTNLGVVIARSMLHAGSINDTVTRCCSERIVVEHFVGNLSVNEGDPYIGAATLTDGRVGLYGTLRTLLFGATRGIWQAPVLVHFDFMPAPAFELPAIFPLRNATGHFLGVVIGSYSVANIDGFLRNVKPTAGSEVFAVDRVGAMLASTHAASYVTLRNSTDRDEPLPDNCGSTAVVASATATEFTVGCRAFARDYGHAPLRGVSGDDELMRPAAAVVKRVSIDGTFYAAATPVENRFNVFGVNIVLLMPEGDVVGDIYRARNITLAIVSAVLVIAVLCAFAASHAMLAPLAIVSRQMHNTSRLREDGTAGGATAAENQKLSSMAEIRELQIAYGAMSTAIRSFTRYVPREVVKDLIASGQLCEIAMRPHYCAMLFSDIAGFTSMCERVPVAELSGLISVYFDRMSAAVMNHDGVVDKYIGDAVMAVWGAPVSAGHEPLKALMAGIAMIRESKVDPIRGTFDQAGELLRIRVGVADGEVLAGNMGCSARMSYTVIGDAVNLAARLESLCREFGANILASGSAVREAEGLVTGRRLRKVAVVGKHEAVPVYEILGLKNSPDAEEIAALRAAEDRSSNLFNNQSEDAEVALSTARSSRRSFPGAYSGTFARRHEDHKARNAAEMVANLSALSEPTVVVPAALDKHCALVSAASTLLDDRLPADAMDQLRQADEVCGSDVVAGYGSPHAVEQLRERCEAALRDPIAFDPVLNLETKA